MGGDLPGIPFGLCCGGIPCLCPGIIGCCAGVPITGPVTAGGAGAPLGGMGMGFGYVPGMPLGIGPWPGRELAGCTPLGMGPTCPGGRIPFTGRCIGCGGWGRSPCLS
jgi:hypothetical protein